ncbi:MAG: aldo/keto reductase [Actinomycetota bacterium]|nr:aldo/keto reductase [Actinomycetota bacterium]
MNELRSLGTSGLLVSPLTLGTMTMANPQWGSTDEESAAVLDAFIEAGGNHIDTADVYSGGGSEELIGAMLEQRGLRDAVVLATKYGFAGVGGPVTGGSGRAMMTRAVEGSLRRLRTEVIDLYWMHVWDTITPAEEVLGGMADLVRAGKIRYYGLSNVPAWFATQVTTLARAHALPAPVALQLEYSLVSRDIEREHIPAATELGLGIVPWSPLAGGFLTGKYTNGAQQEQGRLTGDNPFGNSKFTDHNWDVLNVLRDVAKELDRTPADIATAWVLNKRGVDTVLVGARTPRHLEAGLAAVDHALPDDARQRLDEVTALTLGNPYGIFTPEMTANIVGGGRPTRRLRP